MHRMIRVWLAMALGSLGFAVGALPAHAAGTFAVSCTFNSYLGSSYSVSPSGIPGGVASIYYTWTDSTGAVVASLTRTKPVATVVDTSSATYVGSNTYLNIKSVVAYAKGANGSTKATATATCN